MNIKKLLVLTLFLLSSVALANTFNKVESYKVKNILELEINTPITPATYDYIFSATQELNKDNNLLLIKLNTPGGLVSTTKKIITLFGSSNYPVVIWITPEGASATSAGAIISSSAHLLFMTEGTNIGAATPIEMSGDIEKKDVRNKAINDLVALVKGLSETRGRNAEMFAEMISLGSSFSSRDALKKNIINGITNSNSELINQISDKVVVVKGISYKLDTEAVTQSAHTMSVSQSVLSFFANPSLAYILFLIGVALIYLEFQAPGGYVAGSAGVMALLIAAISFQVLPVNIGAIGLIAVSMVLFVLEIYITSYGLLSIFGVASFATGSLLLFKTDDSFLYVNKTMMITTTLGILSAMGLISYFFLKDIRRKKPSFFSLVDKEATIIEVNDNGEYTIKVMGEIWKARSKDNLNINDKCIVTSQDKKHIMLEVTKTKEQ